MLFNKDIPFNQIINSLLQFGFKKEQINNFMKSNEHII